jgi:hypothetical protein
MHSLLTISTIVLQLITQKPETPNAPETASSPTQDTASSLELASAPAVLDDNADDQWCGYGYLWTFPCPKVLSSPSSLSKIHLVIIKYVSAIPGKIAASFGTSTTFKELKNRDLLTTDFGGLDKRQDCTPNLVDGTWKCCFPDLLRGGLVCNAGSSLSPPRIFAIPTLFFKALSSIPGALAAVIPEKDSISEVDKRQDCTPNLVDGTWKCCFPDLVDGGLKCSAGSSLSPPRIFTLPALLFKVLSSVPQAIAAAVPHPLPPSELKEKREDGMIRDVQAGQTESNCWINEMGMQQCFTFTPNAGSSSLRIPRIFSLPTLFITLIKQVSSVSALPQHLTESLAAPNLDLVRKTVHEAGEALNNWVEERQLPICRPGQPPNLPCQNDASRFSLSYLLSVPLLAFGVMVWL